MEPLPRWNPISVVAGRLFRRRLQERGPAITFARLCTSRHLHDLQFIAVFVVIIALISLVVAIVTFKTADLEVHSTLAGALAAIAAAVLNWIYQAGSRRMGAVDLFACEISVICRVCLVVDFAQSSVTRAPRAAPGAPADHAAPRNFSSEEHYTPVYDGQLSELEPLDVNVVTYVTEFYTYRKTMMDYLRAIPAAGDPRERDRLTNEMIYMQYLMYESGRLAIRELIEFEPNRAESLVNILCSELVLYGFLQERYQDDFRGRRLALRREQYERLVPRLDEEIAASRHPSWERARTTAPEMMRRYWAMRSELEAKQGAPGM